jgi:hypothetical protein
MSLSFIAPSSLAVDDAHEVRNLGDHAANGRRVLKRGATTDLVEPEDFFCVELLLGN